MAFFVRIHNPTDSLKDLSRPCCFDPEKNFVFHLKITGTEKSHDGISKLGTGPFCRRRNLIDLV